LPGAPVSVFYTLHGDKRAMYVVAREDGGVRGYAKVVPSQRARIPEGQRWAEIVDLWVNPEYRREGVGTGMVREVSDWAMANGFTHVGAEASAVDEAGNLFLRWLGFAAGSTVYGIAVEAEEK
jgi:GNAT superfamily N-acetyltransferase